jgi:type I restriction enzyme S subunit
MKIEKKNENCSNLPDGWEVKKLGDICEVQRGLTYSGKDTVDYSDNIVLRATNINLENSNLDLSQLKYLRYDLQINEKYKLNKGSLLICFSSGSKSHLGKVALVNDDYKFYFGGFIGQIKPSKEILSKYLLYSLISDTYKTYILELTDGVNINNLKIKDLQAFKIPLPPLSEQQRIVGILDEAFEAIDKAKENAEQNLKNAQELFENSLQTFFNNKKWKKTNLGKLASFKNGMNFTKGSHGESIEIVGVRNFQNNFWVPFQKLDKVVIDGTLSESYLLKEGDIITVRSNGNPKLIGRTLLAGQVKGNISHSGFTIRIRLSSDVLVPLFLCYYLKTQKTRSELIDSGNGVGIKSLNQTSLSALMIPVPNSIEEQNIIVEKLDKLSVETKKLELIYQHKLDNLQELKKSILQKAFSGEL